jgi:type I restriction enzyme M protein
MSARNTVKSIQDVMRQDVSGDGDAQRISQLCGIFFLKIIDDQDQEFERLNPGDRSPIPKPLQWRTWAADPEGLTGVWVRSPHGGRTPPNRRWETCCHDSDDPA